jgi:hypothetical protein
MIVMTDRAPAPDHPVLVDRNVSVFGDRISTIRTQSMRSLSLSQSPKDDEILGQDRMLRVPHALEIPR